MTTHPQCQVFNLIHDIFSFQKPRIMKENSRLEILRKVNLLKKSINLLLESQSHISKEDCVTSVVCLYVHSAECPQSGSEWKSFETLNASIKPAVANMMAQIKSRHSLILSPLHLPSFQPPQLC